jgi:O-antigen ligase
VQADEVVGLDDHPVLGIANGLGKIDTDADPLMFLNRQWRWLLLLLGILGTYASVRHGDTALRGLHAWSGDAREDKQAQVVIDGQRVAYTSTLHRIYLWKVYGKAIRQAGLLGYGSDRTSVFPPIVPMGGDHDEEALKKLWCIDNQYLLLLLRMGWLGMSAWILVLASAGYAASRLAIAAEEASRFFWGAMLGSIAAATLVLITVWMPHDFGFLLLWNVGAVSGAYSQWLTGDEDDRW